VVRVALAVGLLALMSGIGADGSAAEAAEEPPGRHDPPAGSQRTVIRYGPYTAWVPCTPGTTCAHYNPGNQFELFAEQPCTGCYLTSMQVDLVAEDGTPLTAHDGMQIRNFVLFNREPARTDATCQEGQPFPLGALFGQRFLVGDDTRQRQALPAGYGYRIGTDSTWNLVWQTHNTSTIAHRHYYEVTFDWVPASAPGMRDVEPVALGPAPCDFGTTVEAGRTAPTGTWTVNRPGDVMAVFGHLVDGGRRVTVRNDTTGRLICDMRARYGERPGDGVAHLSSITSCPHRPAHRPVARLVDGQQLSVTTYYHVPEQTTAAATAAMAYVAPPNHGRR
jgi:hypothetical protein